jgi:hypothetical protein
MLTQVAGKRLDVEKLIAEAAFYVCHRKIPSVVE